MTAQPAPRLLITRPRQAAEAFAADLEAEMPGAWRIEIAPLLEIIETGGAPELTAASDLVFTSSNAVRIAAASGPGAGRRAHCVGPGTTAVAAAAGFSAAMRGASAEELARRIVSWPVEPPRRFLHLRGVHGIGELAATLRAAGHDAREQIVYEQRGMPLAEEVRLRLAQGAYRAVTLFSPRTAKRLGRETEADGIAAQTILLCLSPAIARTAARYHRGTVLAAESPDRATMIGLLRDALRG